jgi:hypothetical protein
MGLYTVWNRFRSPSALSVSLRLCDSPMPDRINVTFQNMVHPIGVVIETQWKSEGFFRMTMGMHLGLGKKIALGNLWEIIIT